MDLHVLAELSHEHLTLHTNKLSLRTQPFLLTLHREHSNTTQHRNALQHHSTAHLLPLQQIDLKQLTNNRSCTGQQYQNPSFFFLATLKVAKTQKSKSFTLASLEQKSRHYAIKTAGEHTQIHMYTHSRIAYIYFFVFFSTAAKQLWHDILCHSIWPWMDMAEERDVKCAKAFVMPIVKQKQIF